MDIPDNKQLLLDSSLNIIHIKQGVTKKWDLEQIADLIDEYQISNIGAVFERR